LPSVVDENEIEDDFMVDDDNNVVLPYDDQYPTNAFDDSASGSKEEEDQPD
jgi:hypothetical protein